MFQQSEKPLVAVSWGTYSTEIIYAAGQFSQRFQEARRLPVEPSSTCDAHFDEWGSRGLWPVIPCWARARSHPKYPEFAAARAGTRL